jgi:hypothetical protein
LGTYKHTNTHAYTHTCTDTNIRRHPVLDSSRYFKCVCKQLERGGGTRASKRVSKTRDTHGGHSERPEVVHSQGTLLVQCQKRTLELLGSFRMTLPHGFYIQNAQAFCLCRLLRLSHTHTYPHARARTYTHTHKHTQRSMCVCLGVCWRACTRTTLPISHTF